MAVTVSKDWTTVKVQSVIPQRKPFLFIDYIADCVPGESISVAYWVDPKHPVFEGHFPDEPIFPGVLLIEAVAQATAIAIMALPENVNYQPLLHKVEDFKFSDIVRPRDCLMIMVRDIEIHKRGRLSGNQFIDNGLIVGKASGRIDVNEKAQIAQGTICFSGIKKV